LWYRLYDEEFDDYNALGVHGDDSLLAITESILGEWNGQVIAQMSKEIFNHTHTDSAKGTELSLSSDIHDEFYLQRKFRIQDGVVLSPLNPQSLYSSVQWNAKTSAMSKDQLFCQVTHGAIREWALHGREAFEHHKTILNKFLTHVNPNYYFDESWEDRWAYIVENAKS